MAQHSIVLSNNGEFITIFGPFKTRADGKKALRHMHSVVDEPSEIDDWQFTNGNGIKYSLEPMTRYLGGML